MRQQPTARNCEIGKQNVHVAISGCRLLLQSPRVSLCELGVVENPQFAVRTVIPSAVVSDVLMYKCFRFWRPHCHFRLSFVVAIARGQFIRIGRGRKPQICHLNCSDIRHTVADVSTSGFDDHIIISGGLSMSHLCVDTFFDLAWLKTLSTALGLQ